jgi:cytochrome c553
LLRAAPPDAIRVEVIGHQWWWQVRYPRDGAPPVELANEIHLPVGRTVEFTLDGRDVIHSFWIPSLGGKMDMIPGRRTRLLLEPTRVGTYRGVCAEFCGTSHARMSFAVVVQSPEDFDRWLAEQATASATPSGTTAARGARVFAENGCGGCHQVRGTDAVGRIGPDLTHVIADPLERLERVHHGTESSKATANALGARTMTDITQVLPGTLSGLAARLYSRLGLANRVKPFLNTVITNVPGPQVPLYFTSAKMVGLYGMGPVMDGMGLIHPVFSFSGRISISVTACCDQMPDPGFYAECLQASFDELLGAAQVTNRG